LAPTVLTSAEQAWLTAFSLILLAFGIAIYSRLIARLRRAGGEVGAASFDLPDLLVSIVLASFFGGLVVRAALKRAEAAEMTPEQVLPSSLMFVGFVAGLCFFLFFRGIRISEVFGFARVSAARVAGWAALLLLAAFPFVGAANAITLFTLKNEAAEQPLVKLFRSAAERGDASTIGIVLLAGVVLAPVCEEFLFRGFFYGVGKRYAGARLSGLLTAALFAAFHASLTSLPGLFVLAVALTLAYERTGSLAVPMTMHALFNATSLALLYLQSIAKPSA